MSKIKLICVDMDAVVASFCEAACKEHGIELPNPIPSDTFLYDKVGSKKKFWSKCASKSFFENIPLYPWSKDLINTIDKSGINWIILTKAPMGSDSLAGKESWWTKHFGRFSNKLWIMRGSKALMAQDGYLLIDDKLNPNGEDWVKAHEGAIFYHWPELHPSQIKEANLRIEEIKILLS